MDMFPEVEKKREKRKTFKCLSLEERKIIKEMCDKGFLVYHIAEKLNRHCSTITNDLKRCGKRENYDPKKAQKIYEENKGIRITKIKTASKEFWKRTREIEQRIISLEMQMDILIEQIRKIKGNYDL